MTRTNNTMVVSKTSVMSTAWAIFKKGTVTTFADALRKAWQAMKLKAAMTTQVVAFTFRKASGEIRKALGTLKAGAYDYTTKGTGHHSLTSVCYWDVEKHGFRSFSVGSLL